jgi:arginine-tRNA-protein transferase
MALAAGWYRIQQMLFTTDVLSFSEIQYQAIWLRVDLHDFVPDKTNRTLAKKNKQFRTEITGLLLTPEHEDLFANYKKHLPFDTASSLHSLLYGDEEINVFNSHLINMYDEDTLIATGAFDLGHQSAAGIFSVYDPEYKQFSPGKYLIYEKMEFCKREGFTWFYPGYYVPGYARFDYKKEMGKGAIEYYDREWDRWFRM